MLRARPLINIPLIHRRCIASGIDSSGSNRSNRSNSTCGIIVIGNEVLRGDVRDWNAYFLVKSLRTYRVSVRRINFVGDDPREIGAVVKDFSKRFDLVFTFGGVGPTHDDITYEAIADVFDQRIQLHRGMWEMFQLYLGQLDDNSPLAKFARIPEGAVPTVEQVSHDLKVLKVCFVKLENVIILPGVPVLVEKIFPVIVKRLGLEQMPEISKELFLTLDEASIAKQLNEVVVSFKDVTFGSYPVLYGNYFKTRLRLESPDSALLEEAEGFLMETLPPGAVLDRIVGHPLEAAHKRVEALATKYDFVREAYDIIQETLRRYRPEEICVGFSGGKDCTVVAYLYYAALQDYKDRTNAKDLPQSWFYVCSGKVRPEVDRFISECVSLYGAQLSTSELTYKDALQRAIDTGFKVFLLGNRSADPKGGTLQHFKETDPDWPRAMRAFPILRWEYTQVWTFIRELYIPYCTLYDQGFSSLGERSTPNPELMFVDERGVTRFKPAYTLQNASTERIGRV